MKYPRIKDYPDSINIGFKTWRVRFVKKIEGGEEDWRGYCSEEDRTILVVSGQGPRKTYETFLHECLHAIEHEYKINISHKTIYELEAPLANLILGNLYSL